MRSVLAYQPTRDLWQLLPNEIRIEIFKNAADLPTIRNLLVASPTGQSLYSTDASEIRNAVRNNEHEDMKEMRHNISGIRYALECNSALTLRDLRMHGARKRWPPLQLYSCTNDVCTLFLQAEVIDTIDRFVASCVRKCVLILSDQADGAASYTKLYRVSRAFWRF